MRGGEERFFSLFVIVICWIIIEYVLGLLDDVCEGWLLVGLKLGVISFQGLFIIIRIGVGVGGGILLDVDAVVLK